MSEGLPEATQRVVETPHGKAVGSSYRWEGGQYCAIHTSRGVVGCGIYDIACANEFGMAFALAKGTPEQPLLEPEDLYGASIVRVSETARTLGIKEGMTGMAALARMLED
ncbi:MAG: hypothetical protein CMN05_07285 [Roseibacillus sp.]|jgi:uncharacterized protein YunC (DUF1805 family)|nr:hypothetical protein [Roseibacillus sp.]MCP4729612.1 DUF1805 domain-containing protein [Roseibacillus sp.]MDP7306329.1 DUF1805 domain-containing protein [Roseibacillus sp.]MDP7494897.1 DUF1805 domain-containing protein [Roseibacillus sp.]HJM62298.1 DUF1805 domain-containing protein [Roseibacillus sp.]|tara:strand:- start:85 stop:414 length:330 start_codon:yes stop_codon:yes gene_type:complete